MSYSKLDWEKLVKRIAVNSASIHFSKHALSQMKKRKISQSMALDALRKGKISLEPEPDIRSGHIICRMERFTAGVPITVAVACENENASDCIVVTAFVIGG